MPYGDVLIHAGDFTELGLPSEVKKFNEWLGRSCTRSTPGAWEDMAPGTCHPFLALFLLNLPLCHLGDFPGLSDWVLHLPLVLPWAVTSHLFVEVFGIGGLPKGT